MPHRTGRQHVKPFPGRLPFAELQHCRRKIRKRAGRVLFQSRWTEGTRLDQIPADDAGICSRPPAFDRRPLCQSGRQSGLQGIKIFLPDISGFRIVPDMVQSGPNQFLQAPGRRRLRGNDFVQAEGLPGHRIRSEQARHLPDKPGRQRFAVRQYTQNQLFRRHSCRQRKSKISRCRPILGGSEGNADFAQCPPFPVVIQPAFAGRRREFSFRQPQHKYRPEAHSAAGFRRHHLDAGILPVLQSDCRIRQQLSQQISHFGDSRQLGVFWPKSG